MSPVTRSAIALVFTALLAPGAAAQLSPPVVLPGATSPQPTAGTQSRAQIARGGSMYLAVWEDTRANLAGTVATNGYGLEAKDVLAVRLSASGQPLDASPIVVSGAPFEQMRPQVAWNGSHWLVVWESRRVQQYTTTKGVYAARIAPDGTLLDDPPILIDDDDSVEEIFPVVASDGQRWAVLWNDYDPQSQLAQVRGAVVHGSGLVLSKTTLASASLGFLLPTNVRLAFAQDRYLMTSEHYPPSSGSSWDVWGRMFDPDLAPLGPEFLIDGSGGDGTKSLPASNGSSFYVVWNGFGGRGTPVALDGTVAIPGGVQLAPSGQIQDAELQVVWDGASWLVAFDAFGFSSSEVRGVRVDTAGNPGTSFLIASHQAQLIDSVVAAGAAGPGSALAVWTDSRLEYADLFGRALDAQGAVGPELPITTSAPQQVHPDLAGSLAAGYLAVFLERVSGQNRILAQRLDGVGAPVDQQPFELATGIENNVVAPRVAFDGARWLVVWERRNGTQPVRIEGRRVEPDGSLPDFFPIDIVAGNTPDVAALNGQFLVVSSHEPTNHIRYVRTQVVDGASGALVGGMQTASGSYAVLPRVEALGGRWLVVWQRHPTHDSPYTSIQANFVAAGGSPESAFFVESAPANTRAPSVGRLGDLGLIAFHGGPDARARRIQADGTLLDPVDGFLLSNAPNVQFGVEAAGDGVRFLTAWTDYRLHTALEAGLGDVYAARVSPAGALLDPSGIAVGNDFYLPEGDPAVAGDGGVAVIAYVDFLPQPPYTGWRVVVRTLTEGGVGTPGCAGTAASCPCGNAGGAGEGCANATGAGGVLAAFGSASVAADDLVFAASNLPAGQFAMLFHGSATTAAPVPFGDGQRCVAAPVIRYPLTTSSPAGGASWGPGLASFGWSAGTTLHFQAWYRDPAGPCGGGANLTASLSVDLLP